MLGIDIVLQNYRGYNRYCKKIIHSFKLKKMTINRKRYNSDEERAKAMLLIWLEQSGEGTYGKFFTSHEDNCDLAKERVRRRVRLRDVCV